jgi:hypothetical protein
VTSPAGALRATTDGLVVTTYGLYGLIVLVVASAAAGCAPSLSTFQPAHVAPKGHVSASMGIEGNAPVGAFETLLDEGKTLAKQGASGMPLTDDDKWKIFDAGVNLILLTPSVGPHFGVTYVPIERFEVGVRYAGSAWRGGARYQLLDHISGPFDLTVGLGVSRFSYGFPLSDQIPGLSLSDFTRWQVDVPILIGTSRDWFHVWAGPKLLFTSFSTELTLSLPNDTTLASFDGTATFVGGQGGLAIGWRRLFLAFELTLAEAIGTAHLTAVVLAPPTHDTKITSFTVYPSLGLLAEF